VHHRAKAKEPGLKLLLPPLACCHAAPPTCASMGETEINPFGASSAVFDAGFSVSGDGTGCL
jgi:hypothetical protein